MICNMSLAGIARGCVITLCLLAGKIAAASEPAFAYIANQSSNNISVINSETGTVVSTIAVASRPYGIAVNPAGTRVYVSHNSGSGGLSVIDTISGHVIASPSSGIFARGIALNPSATRLYVANTTGVVSVLDTTTNTLLTNITVQSSSEGVVANMVMPRIYVTHQSSNSVSVIDTGSNTLLTTIGVGNRPSGIAVNPTGTRIYVANTLGNSASVIDASSNAVIATVPLASNPSGIAVDPSGAFIYIAHPDNDTVTVIDASSNAVVGTMAVGNGPLGLAFDPSGDRIFVINSGDRRVSIIDADSWTVITNIAVGLVPMASGNFVGVPPPGTVPGVPTISAVIAGAASASVVFNPPVDDGGLAITGYRVTANPGGMTKMGIASPLTLTGLSPGTAYTFTVSAGNVIGNSLPSSPSGPVTPMAAPATPRAYVANYGSKNISVIDTSSQAVIATIPLATSAWSVAMDQAGTRAYAGDGNAIAVIDTASNTIISTIPTTTNPNSNFGMVFGLALNTDGSKAYAMNYNNRLSVIDTVGNTEIASIGTSSSGDYNIALNPHAPRAYMTGSSYVQVLDTTSNTIVANVYMGSSIAARDIAVNPAGTTAYVATSGSMIALLDTATNTIASTIPMPDGQDGIAINPAGTRLYATQSNSNKLLVIDVAAGVVLTTLVVGSSAKGVAVSRDGSLVYVANYTSNSVSVIDAASNTVIATVPVGSGPMAFGNFLGGPSGATVPAAIVQATATAAPAAASISFLAPVNDGGAAIQGYRVTANPGGMTATGTASPLAIGGLAAGIPYTFSVAAFNAIGAGPSSPASNPVIPTAAARISISDFSVAEGNAGTTVANVTMSLDKATVTPVTFSIASSDGTAQSGSDYVTVGETGLSIPTGQTSITFSVTLNADTSIEPDETFTLTLGNVVGADVLDGSAQVTISDDDGPALRITDLSITEGNSGSQTVFVSLELQPAAQQNVTYNIATANGTATSGSDYTTRSLSNQVIPAGSTSAYFSISVKGDTTIEPDETVLVNISNVSGARLADSQGVVTIINNDGIQMSIADLQVTEGNSGSKTATVTLSLDRASTTPISFDIATSDIGGATAGSDYQALNLVSQTIPAGQTSKTFDLTIFGDSVRENDEPFLVTISHPTGAAIARGQATVTIINDDLPTISITNNYLNLEGNSGTTAYQFTVSLSTPVSTPITFDIATVDGTATAGSDYVAMNLVNQRFAPGEPSKTYTVIVNGDTDIEPYEDFFVVLSNVNGAVIGTAQGTGTIMNDDNPPPIPTLYINNATIVEGNSGTQNAAITIGLTAPAPTTVSFDFATANISAAAGSDYSPVSLTGLSIPTGASSLVVQVPVHGDTLAERDEAVQLILANVSGALASSNISTLVIRNDDLPVLTVSDASVIEGDEGTRTLAFIVSLDQPSPYGTSFKVSTSAGTASAGADFIAQNAVLYNIFSSQATTITIPVVVNGDTLIEDDETLTVTISDASNVTIADAVATGTILNDDSAPVLSISDLSVIEGHIGARAASFTVSLTRPAQPGGVSFDVSTPLTRSTGSSALAGSDYIAIPATHITIAEGQSLASVNVKILGDTRREQDEMFLVNLDNVTGATVAKSRGEGTIINDDATHISSVQGNGTISPVAGSTVVVQGIATAVTRHGFFLQGADDEQDADPLTSEGIFVRAPVGSTGNVAIGQRLEVHGSIREQPVNAEGKSSRTELVAAGFVAKGGIQPLPVPATIVTSDFGVSHEPSRLERLEGMRVTATALVVVGPGGANTDTAHNDAVFHVVPAGMPRLQLDPGQSDRMAANRLLRVDSLGQRGSSTIPADVGDTLHELIGVLDEGAEAYTVLPDADREPTVSSRARPRPASKPGRDDSLIAYLPWTRMARPDNSARGLTTASKDGAELLRIAKAGNAICSYLHAPAIIAVAGIEDSKVLADLADASNGLAGNVLFPGACSTAMQYRALSTGTDKSGPSIGFLLDERVLGNGRPTVRLLQSARFGQSEMYSSANSELSPLFEQAPVLLRVQLSTGHDSPMELTLLVAAANGSQANRSSETQASRLARKVAQSEYLSRFTKDRQARFPDENLVVLGEFDDSGFRTSSKGQHWPRTMLPTQTDSGLSGQYSMLDLMPKLPVEERYSSVLNGIARLDSRALASSSFARRHALRVGFARINADFATEYAQSHELPMRISDDDPMILYIGGK